MARRSSKIPKAIPTLFNEIKYRSRLEARFAELLFNSGCAFQYEKPLPGSFQGYVPDFYIKKFRLYVEIKPEPLRCELDIFRKDIDQSQCPWIWVDSLKRGSWSILRGNTAFISTVTPCVATLDISSDKIRFNMRYLDLFPVEEPEPILEPLKEESAEESWRKVSESLSDDHFGQILKIIIDKNHLLYTWVKDTIFDFSETTVLVKCPCSIVAEALDRPRNRSFLIEAIQAVMGPTFSSIKFTFHEGKEA